MSVRAKSWNPDGTTDDPEVELDLDLVDGRRPQIRSEFLSELEFGVVELIEGRDTKMNRNISNDTLYKVFGAKEETFSSFMPVMASSRIIFITRDLNLQTLV